MIVQHAKTWGALRQRSNDERLATWAAKYYGAGLHRRPELSNAQTSAYFRTATKDQDHEKR